MCGIPTNLCDKRDVTNFKRKIVFIKKNGAIEKKEFSEYRSELSRFVYIIRVLFILLDAKAIVKTTNSYKCDDVKYYR